MQRRTVVVATPAAMQRSANIAATNTDTDAHRYGAKVKDRSDVGTAHTREMNVGSHEMTMYVHTLLQKWQKKTARHGGDASIVVSAARCVVAPPSPSSAGATLLPPSGTDTPDPDPDPDPDAEPGAAHCAPLPVVEPAQHDVAAAATT
jgi:hypothetical protein